jgi:hypothetical protein
MVDSSFYVDGETYDTAVVESNDHPGASSPSQAPSGFYPGGTVYSETDPDVAAAYATAAEDAADRAALSEASAALSATNAASAATAAATAAVAGAAGTATPIVDGTAAVGTSTKWAHEDHVHPTDASRASVTALGLKADKTYVDTQDALKADKTYVDTQDALKADKTYVDTQDATKADTSYVNTQLALKAPLASPAFTSVPTAPTPTAGDNSTKVATTAFVTGNLGTKGHLLAEPSNGSAAAGEVGQSVSSALSVTLSTSNTSANCGSITLAAGDWDVSAAFVFNAATGATAGTDWYSILSTISTPSISPGNAIDSTQYHDRLASVSDHSGVHAHVPYRLSLSASTTIYAHAQATFSAGTGYAVTGILSARRMR